MKKLVALCLAAVMVFALTACGTETKTTTAAETKAAETSAAAAETTAAAAIDPLTLTICQAGSTIDSVLGQGFAKLEELIEEYSGGAIQVEAFYDTELGGIDAEVAGAFDGTIDIVCCGPSYLSAYVKEIQVFDLPMLFDNYDQINATLDGEPGQFIASKFEGSGVKLMTYFHSGLRSITNNVQQINSVDDVKGLKIRVAPSETQIATWNGFGAIATPMSSAEVYTSMQTNAIDAQENGLTWIWSAKIYEVSKFLSLTQHSYTSMPVIFNEAKWNSLTAAQQEVLTKAIKEAADYERAQTAALEAQIVDDIEKAGVAVNRTPDRSGFKPLAQDAYDVFNKAMGSDEMLKMVQDFVAKLGK